MCYKRGDALFILEDNWQPEALDGVIAQLDTVHGGQAVRILAKQPDERGLLAIIAKAKRTTDCAALATIGQALAEHKSPAAAEALRDAAEKQHLGLVAGGVRYFLALGDSTYDELLIAAYRACPTTTITDAVTWSGNADLKAKFEKARAAERDENIEKYREWQKRNAQTTPPPARPSPPR